MMKMLEKMSFYALLFHMCSIKKWTVPMDFVTTSIPVLGKNMFSLSYPIQYSLSSTG
jgi:hypothetical protein